MVKRLYGVTPLILQAVLLNKAKLKMAGFFVFKIMKPVQEKQKPFGHKNYGSIPHLSGSRLGEKDYMANPGQELIATVKKRDKHDEIIVQEKLDGSNVGVGLLNGVLIPMSRAGYPCSTSPYRQHWEFENWVYTNEDRFRAVLKEGERLVGEWLMQAHGTRYELKHAPFVVFDLMVGQKRRPFAELFDRVNDYFVMPHLLHKGDPISIPEVLRLLGEYGHHGAIDKVEGAMWRVERNAQINNHSSERRTVVDFLAKYVRPDKVDGCYLTEKTGGEPVWNWLPSR